MSESFTLHVPIDAAYLALAPEVATRYAELSGASSGDAAALAAALVNALARVTAGAQPEAGVDLAFRLVPPAVHVDLSCNGHRESVTVKIPAGTR